MTQREGWEQPSFSASSPQGNGLVNREKMRYTDTVPHRNALMKAGTETEATGANTYGKTV